MSNKFNKIQKNAENLMLDNFYKTMTPDQYKRAINTAIAQTKLDMANFYEKEYRKLYNEFNSDYQHQVLEVIDTMSVELIHELAVQMNAFEEDDEFRRNCIIDRVQEIYTNVMDSIKSYSTMDKKVAEKQYEEKKKKVEKMFNLKF